MVVVPALAHGQDAEQEVIAALVVAVVGLFAPQVADGVNAPGHVVHQEDPGQAAPHQAEQGPQPAAFEQPAQTAGISKPRKTHTGNRALAARTGLLWRRSLT